MKIYKLLEVLVRNTWIMQGWVFGDVFGSGKDGRAVVKGNLLFVIVARR